jgi:hypothetical protein
MQWVKIDRDTHYMVVAGGTIYRSTGACCALCFVPWVQSASVTYSPAYSGINGAVAPR